MIPDIGLIIGFYVLTRMFGVILPRRKDGTENVVVQLLAAVTALVAVFAMIDLVAQGANAAVPTY